MIARAAPAHYVPSRIPLEHRLHTGDLVVLKSGAPLLLEVLSIEEDGLIRVRGNAWPPGYSILLSIQEVFPSAELLAD
jgi:hypothetical protein